MNQPLIKVDHLSKHFALKKSGLFKERRYVRAVDDVSFLIGRGESFGLVGESGCGKTTVGRSILRLTEPTAGRVEFEGRDVTHFKRPQLKTYRRHAQMIFQDPFASLNPRMTLADIVGEPLLIHRIGSKKERRRRIITVLETVGIDPGYMQRFAHEFSGGQRQRIGIARVLTLNPKLIVADEPVSALDVSIQAQIVNLLVRLKDDFQMSYLFISHDLAVVEHIADRVAIMYLGHIVETAPSELIYKEPRHPYTQALLTAIPRPDPDAPRQRTILEGDLPNPAQPPSGCPFRTRCPQAVDQCTAAAPAMTAVGPGHFVSCHRVDA